ncbi:MAG: hypothetical protein ACYDC6_08970 [Acidobacteriaceae bacterium]
MLKKAEAQQQETEMVSIESLVPVGHLLRNIDGAQVSVLSTTERSILAARTTVVQRYFRCNPER